MHRYIIGRSGSGKSTHLENLALANDGAWIFLDPHGQSARKIADSTDCIFWEPADTRWIAGFNPLQNVPPAKRHLVAAEIISSFKSIWSDSWGPRLEWVLLNSILLLLDNNASLLDIPTLLTDRTYRLRCLRRATARQFWDQEFDAWEGRFRNEAIAPVLNKVGPLAANPLLNAILRSNTLNLARVIGHGGTKYGRLAVDLSQTELGDNPSSLLGSLLVSAVWHAAQKVRKPVTLYCDEFHRFATDSFGTILSESRKYSLSLVAGHQYLGQLPEPVRQAVFGNVRHFTVFNVGAEDAPILAREIDVAEDTLKGLSPFEAWMKNGHRALVKMPPPIAVSGRLEANRRMTRAAYARPGDDGGNACRN
jgi:hypothetical protein